MKFTEEISLRIAKANTLVCAVSTMTNGHFRYMTKLARIEVGDSMGTIVGHNSSANFNVLFDDDAPKYAGMTLNVHPQGMEILK